MFVKADRITQRIKEAGKKLTLNRKLPNSDITPDEFKDFIKVVEIIVNDELTERGIARKWKASSQKSENLNNACSQATTKEPTNWLKTLMTKLRLWK